MLHSEITGDIPKELEDSEKIKYSNDIIKLTNTIDTMEKELEMVKKNHESRMRNNKKQYSSTMAKLQEITKKLTNSDNHRYTSNIDINICWYSSSHFIIFFIFSEKNVKDFFSSLKELAKERNDLLKIIQHRNIEHKKLEEELR